MTEESEEGSQIVSVGDPRYQIIMQMLEATNSAISPMLPGLSITDVLNYLVNLSGFTLANTVRDEAMAMQMIDELYHGMKRVYVMRVKEIEETELEFEKAKEMALATLLARMQMPPDGKLQ